MEGTRLRQARVRARGAEVDRGPRGQHDQPPGHPAPTAHRADRRQASRRHDRTAPVRPPARGRRDVGPPRGRARVLPGHRGRARGASAALGSRAGTSPPPSSPSTRPRPRSPPRGASRSGPRWTWRPAPGLSVPPVSSSSTEPSATSASPRKPPTVPRGPGRHRRRTAGRTGAPADGSHGRPEGARQDQGAGRGPAHEGRDHQAGRRAIRLRCEAGRRSAKAAAADPSEVRRADKAAAAAAHLAAHIGRSG